jgi:glycosyltransferase involved in cell wall biosynthesis
VPSLRTGPGTSSTDHNLRVVHVIASLGPGGAERQLEQLVAGDGSTAVVCLYGRGLVADAIEAAGVPVMLLGMSGPRKLTSWVRLALLLHRLAPDVVNVHLLAAQLWGIPAARLARVPLIVSTEHSLMDDTIEGRPHRAWLRAVYRTLERMTHHTVAVSTTTKARLEAWGVAGGRISVIPNAVDFSGAAYDPGARASARRSLGLGPDAPVVGAVGRLEAVKRFDVLIDAAGPVLAGMGATLIIVGEGGLLEDLRARAVTAGIGDRTIFAGPRSDVTALLSAFDLFVSPSCDETFGIAILEAVANGLPVVYGECPALDDLVGPGQVGVRLVPGPEAAGQLVELIASTSPGVRHPVPAIVRDRYDAGRIRAAYATLYADLVLQRPPSSSPALVAPPAADCLELADPRP